MAHIHMNDSTTDQTDKLHQVRTLGFGRQGDLWVGRQAGSAGQTMKGRAACKWTRCSVMHDSFDLDLQLHGGVGGQVGGWVSVQPG